MNKRMGGVTKLSKFSQIKSEDTSKSTAQPQSSPTELSSDLILQEEAIIEEKQLSASTTDEQDVSSQELKSNNKTQARLPKHTSEKLVAINIKIPQPQKEWLGKTASQVRDNNTLSVPAGERVFPQHLVVVAIELLKQAEVDWNQIKNMEELKKVLALNNIRP